MTSLAIPGVRRHALAASWGPLLLGASMSLAAFTQARAQAVAPAPVASGVQQAAAQNVTVTGARADSYTVSDTAAATRLTLSPRETPQSLTTVTRERLDDQNLTTLRAVLDNTAGIYSNQYDTERVLFYSRGFLINNLLVDGVPALASFDTGSVDDSIDTAVYERIEIVRGASGLTTGVGNPAAAVNLVRKHADSRALALSADFTLGSWQDRRVDLDASVPLTADGRIRARAVAVGEDTHSYQDLYHKKKAVLYGIVDADLTPSTRLSLGFDYQSGKPRSPTWGSFPLFLSTGEAANWPRSFTTSTDWTFWNRRTQTVFAQLEHRFDNGWDLRTNLSKRVFDESDKLFYVYGFPDPADGSGVQPYAYASKGRIAENALDVYATGPFELLGRKHELVIGYTGSRARNKGTEQDPVDDLAAIDDFFTWNNQYAEPAFGDPILVNDIRTRQDAAYVAARLSLADPLKLVAGARYARWAADSYYIYDSTAADFRSDYDAHKLVPYAGLVWDLGREFSAFASYTGIFMPQSSRDVNGRYLDPMVGRSAEVGLKGEHFGGRLNTSLTFFVTHQDNVAELLLDDEGNPVLGPNNNSVYYAVDGTKTTGFEFEASGRLTSELQGTLGWTHNSSRVPGQGTIRAFIPAAMVRLFGTWDARRLVGGLTLGGGLNWQSATWTNVSGPDGGVVLRQGGFAQLGLMARYQFSPTLSLQINGNNVTDRRFYVLDGSDNTYYGAPASWSATLRMAY